ncbi:MAG: hypothetical protein M4579_007377 [Chaenotheca gracillima]|nr:MAG: hypothetical protein M4579_007377 [Chaenotheca gracillima]
MEYELLGIGATSIVSGAEDETVLKGWQVWKGDRRCAYRESEDGSERLFAREDSTYRVLGEHPHILRCLGLVEVHENVRSLRLERAPHGNVREFIGNNKSTSPSEADRMKMALGVASGMAHSHAKKIIHCDMSCRNLFLFPGYLVKIGDFGSAMVNGDICEGAFCEESRYELPRRGREFDNRPYLKRELFALGSAIYEILAWGRPFDGLDDDEVERKFAAEEFPDSSHLAARDIIQDCWNEKFESAKDVEDALVRLRDQQDGEAALKKETLASEHPLTSQLPTTTKVPAATITKAGATQV